MKAVGSRPRLVVSTDGSGVVGHAGARLADLAEATGLTTAYSTVLRPLRPRGTGHDPGRIATDLAVMLADGGEAIADLAVLRDQHDVFGPVASTPTAWRLLANVGERILDRLRSARAAAREVAWLQAAETRTAIPAVKAGGRELPGLVLDLDATLVTCLGERQGRTHLQGGFGRFPSRLFSVNAAWLELSLAAIDLLAWTRVLLLDGELATAEPKKLRYRILYVAARLTRGGRRLHLRIAATWPWRHQLAAAFHRLAALPRPAN